MSGSKFFLLLIGFALVAHAQQRFLPQPGYGSFGAPDQAEGRRILEEFRSKGIAGDYYFELELHILPRRGDERVLAGQMWGTRDRQGPLSRVAIVTDADKKAEFRLLVQNGSSPAVWTWDGTDGAKQLDVQALFSPLAGTNLTAFDLQMPFLYWGDFSYEGMVRMRGRPAHKFLMRAPKDFAAKYPALTGVRIYLDTQFNAMVQVELIGDGDQTLKTISLLELKRIGDQWIPKSFDVRDEKTRDKTRFLVRAAALGLHLPQEIFSPDQLGASASPPEAKSIVPVE